MSFRRRFIDVLSSILDVNDVKLDPRSVNSRLSILEDAIEEKTMEIDGIKEMIAVLIMSNPSVRIIGKPTDMITSGSSGGQGPGGKLLN